MERFITSREILDRITQAVAQFTMLAFEERFLCWTAELNLTVAEAIWNAHPDQWEIADAVMADTRDPQLRALLAHLKRARLEQWADEDEAYVFELEARVKGPHIVLTFLLGFDGCDDFQPCEVPVLPAFDDDPVPALPSG
ncbi:MAG: hypothetical protein QNJ98_08640 [Planctomycetota bacterium]|nr:hypothetical protein [Planctomycetota bacterium]